MKTDKMRKYTETGAYKAVQVAPTFSDVLKLRRQIVLNSLYISDYENHFDFDAYEVCDFFDGYMEYLAEEYKEENGGDFAGVCDVLDMENDENLLEWFDIWAGGVGTFTKYMENDEDEEDEAA